MAKNGRMWLRDFLPKDKIFKKSRIMTFGYTSILVDKRKIDDHLEDYADELLRKITILRDLTPAEQKRPLIFICHSMGGLVARLAMTRLHTIPHKFPGFNLKDFGLLFLSMPHLGSTQADYNKFLVVLSEGLFKLRSDLVKELKSFNPTSVDNVEIFRSMEEKPCFRYLCEGEKTSVMGNDRLVKAFLRWPCSEL
jgi:hypothetical protein